MKHDPVKLLADLVMAVTLYRSMVATAIRVESDSVIRPMPEADPECASYNASAESFMQQADKSEEIVIKLCETAIVDLADYDKENGTDYAEQIGVLYRALYESEINED